MSDIDAILKQTLLKAHTTKAMDLHFNTQGTKHWKSDFYAYLKQHGIKSELYEISITVNQKEREAWVKVKNCPIDVFTLLMNFGNLKGCGFPEGM